MCTATVRPSRHGETGGNRVTGGSRFRQSSRKANILDLRTTPKFQNLMFSKIARAR